MVPTMLKRVAVCAAIAAGAMGVSGCSDRSEYDAKVAELKSQTDKLAKADEKASQLQKDLDAAKSEVGKADLARQNAEAKIRTLDQEHQGLKDQVRRLEQANTGLTAKVSQLQKDVTAAKGEIRKAEKAKRDAERWEITFRNRALSAKIEALADNRFRLGPQSLAFSGVYQFDGKTLSMVAENAAYPNLVWTMKAPGQFEMTEGRYAGASMKRKAAGGAEAGPAKSKTPVERQ
jgi:chromosome segregation ATPase